MDSKQRMAIIDAFAFVIHVVDERTGDDAISLSEDHVGAVDIAVIAEDEMAQRPTGVRQSPESIEMIRREADQLAFALTIAEQRIRSRVADALHDQIGQMLTIARLRVRALSGKPTIATTSDALQELDVLLEQISGHVRTVTYDLSSPVLEQLGLVAAVESLAPRLQSECGLQLHCVTDGWAPASADTSSVLFRIIRELLSNVNTHARASHVVVLLLSDAFGSRVLVRDNGIGFRTDVNTLAVTPHGGYGLSSSLAQMRGLGGDMVVREASGGGTEVELRLPAHAVHRAVSAMAARVHQ